jgi:hypothetical protein
MGTMGKAVMRMGHGGSTQLPARYIALAKNRELYSVAFLGLGRVSREARFRLPARHWRLRAALGT